jgi:hypothetical protein
VLRVDKLRFSVWRYIGIVITVIGISLSAVLLRSYPTTVLQLDEVASTASVLATVRVEHTIRGSSLSASPNRTVLGRAELVVLRAFPPSALHPGQHIQLKYEQLPEGSSPMNGPDVPPLNAGSVWVVPMKPNPKPQDEPGCLIADEGGGTVIPAIEQQIRLPVQAQDKREYLLREVAAALSAGTREEALREGSYLTLQTTAGYAVEMMQLLVSAINGDTDRWAFVSASLVSPLGIPRPSIADFVSGTYGADATRWRGSLAELSVRKVAKSREGREKLINQFLNISDLNEWGSGIALQEFAQAPTLVKELRTMLEAHRPGSLYVAYEVMKAGQHHIVATAMNTAFAYVNDEFKRQSDIQAACWVIRDFGTDAQFKEFLSDLRRYQYQDQKQYDELWRNTIWSDNEREHAVLDILLADQRMYDSVQRYSDIARGELARLSTPKSQ